MIRKRHTLIMINYKKNVWSTNTRLSAEALNNIENGIEMCANAINELEKKINSISNIDVTAQMGEMINSHDIDGSAHSALFDLMSNFSLRDSSIEELKSQITVLKTANTKLSNRVKELEKQR